MFSFSVKPERTCRRRGEPLSTPPMYSGRGENIGNDPEPEDLPFMETKYPLLSLYRLITVGCNGAIVLPLYVIFSVIKRNGHIRRVFATGDGEWSLHGYSVY